MVVAKPCVGACIGHRVPKQWRVSPEANANASSSAKRVWHEGKCVDGWQKQGDAFVVRNGKAVDVEHAAPSRFPAIVLSGVISTIQRVSDMQVRPTGDGNSVDVEYAASNEKLDRWADAHGSPPIIVATGFIAKDPKVLALLGGFVLCVARADMPVSCWTGPSLNEHPAGREWWLTLSSRSLLLCHPALIDEDVQAQQQQRQRNDPGHAP